MINPSDILSVIYSNNSTNSDLSNSLSRYSTRNTETIQLDSSNDYLYLGFEKPFGSVYPAFSTANENENTFSAEYYNGSDWTSLTVIDDTNGFTRNGLIQWTKPTAWATTTVESLTKYWVRFQPSADHSSTVVQGMNLLFADDDDLKTKFPQILASALLQGMSNHLLVHEAVKDEIIQKFRRFQKYKSSNGSTLEAITVWDIHNLAEVRQGAIYLALHYIFLNASSETEDHWYDKATRYKKMYDDMLDLEQVSLDTNDDGSESDSERGQSFYQTTLNR